MQGTTGRKYVETDSYTIENSAIFSVILANVVTMYSIQILSRLRK